MNMKTLSKYWAVIILIGFQLLLVFGKLTDWGNLGQLPWIDILLFGITIIGIIAFVIVGVILYTGFLWLFFPTRLHELDKKQGW